MTFVSYTKNYEDYRLFLALGHVDQGRYIDLSGPVNTLGSVSQAFYERGWSGICNFQPIKNRQRDRFFTGTLADLFVQEADWINAAEIHFLAIDAALPWESLKGLFERTPCRPWLIIVRDQLPGFQNDQMTRVFNDAGYTHCWTDGLNHYWAIGTGADLASGCFAQLTHLDPVITNELLELRVQVRLKSILADALTRTSKKLTEREKEIEQLNQGLKSTRQAYDDAMYAYETVLASSNRFPIRTIKKIVAFPKIVWRQCRLLLVKSVRLPALKALTYLEQRPAILMRLMNALKERPSLEKFVRKLIGKPKTIVPIAHEPKEAWTSMSPDEIKAYQQIIGS